MPSITEFQEYIFLMDVSRTAYCLRYSQTEESEPLFLEIRRRNLTMSNNMDKQSYIDEAEKELLHTYNRFSLVLDHGEGVHLYDTDGNAYLDFAAGIAVCALGYSNEHHKEALKAQVDKLLHTSNLYYNAPVIEAADKVLNASKMDRIFFTNSGTEALSLIHILAQMNYKLDHWDVASKLIARVLISKSASRHIKDCLLYTSSASWRSRAMSAAPKAPMIPAISGLVACTPAIFSKLLRTASL